MLIRYVLSLLDHMTPHHKHRLAFWAAHGVVLFLPISFVVMLLLLLLKEIAPFFLPEYLPGIPLFIGFLLACCSLIGGTLYFYNDAKNRANLSVNTRKRWTFALPLGSYLVLPFYWHYVYKPGLLQERLPDAIELELVAAVESDSASLDALLGLGRYYLDVQGRADKALPHFEMAFELSQNLLRESAAGAAKCNAPQ
jgi:hypothetical protein